MEQSFWRIRGYWNEEEKELFIFRPLDHFQRFLESTQLLRMELPQTREEAVDILLELIRKEDLHEDIYVRPLGILC